MEQQNFQRARLLLIAVLGVVLMGVLMVYSTTSVMALREHHDQAYFLKRHGIFAFLGILVLGVTSHIDYKVWQKFSYPLLGLSLLLMLLVFIPGLGRSSGGAQRWLQIAGFSFQPAELAKITLVIYLADSLSRKGEKIKQFLYGVVPHGVITGSLVGVLLLQPDFGTAVVLLLVMGIMLFAAGVRLKHLFVLVLPVIPAFYFLLWSVPYRRARWTTFLDPWSDPQGSGFQIIQSYLAFGQGGLFGQGLGNGHQKLFYLPEAHTDFIFSVIAEELGFVGVVLMLGLLFFFLWRGFSIASTRGSVFGRLLGFGLVCSIGVQAVLNIAVVVGVLPTKGLPLPFVSYGGSALIANLFAVGILRSISSRD
jgi:cell division protein FtsW